MISNYTFVAGGGGSGGASGYINTSYTIIAAGGGGGAGYTSVAYINSSPITPVVTEIITPKESPNPSQNVSQTLIQIFNPLGESSWLVYLIIIFPMMMMISMMRGGLISMLLPSIIGIIVFGYFFNIELMPLLTIIGTIPMILIMLSLLSDR